MDILYPEIGICGLSCRLCPRYHTEGESRCSGCKTESRMGAGCPFITCAMKKKHVEFCGDCPDSHVCDRWKKHREAAKSHDSFKCYLKLEEDIAFIRRHGIRQFEEDQKNREALLKIMLQEFNEGRSKSYYCIAATILTPVELRDALDEAKRKTAGADVKSMSKALHEALDNAAARNGRILRLRK
jgi:hypothetical protein